MAPKVHSKTTPGLKEEADNNFSPGGKSKVKYSLWTDLKYLPIGIVIVLALHLGSPVRGQMESGFVRAWKQTTTWLGFLHEKSEGADGEQASASPAYSAPYKNIDANKILFRNDASIRVDIHLDDEYDGKQIGVMDPSSLGPKRRFRVGERFFYTRHGTREQIIDASGQRIEHVVSEKTDVVTLPASARVQVGGCVDRHRFCSKEAANGRCSEIPGYMILSCCASCDPYINSSVIVNPEVRCKRDFLNISDDGAWKAGDVDRAFTHITRSKRWAKTGPRILSSPPNGPWIVALDKFISEGDRTALVERSEQLGFQSSKIQAASTSLGEAVGTKQATRISSSTHCHVPACNNDKSVQRVKHRVREMTNVPEGNIELQFVKYAKGEYFKTHLDVEEAQLHATPGIRLLTIFVYLSDVEEGGETSFPLVGVKVPSRRGSAVIFPNVRNEDVTLIDNRTAHAGLPVRRGLKRAANIWLHQYDIEKAFLWGCQ